MRCLTKIEQPCSNCEAGRVIIRVKKKAIGAQPCLKCNGTGKSEIILDRKKKQILLGDFISVKGTESRKRITGKVMALYKVKDRQAVDVMSKDKLFTVAAELCKKIKVNESTQPIFRNMQERENTE